MVILLHSGLEEWDGPRSVGDMLDLTDVPDVMQKLVQDHKINLI